MLTPSTGTFGDVYRCRISGFTCAVKIVNIKGLSETALKMMQNELHFLETLNHESILFFTTILLLCAFFL